MLDKIQLSPSANSTSSFASSAEDTFSRVRRAKSGNKRLPTWSNSEMGSGLENSSNIFDKSNPVHPSEGITSFTPIKALVSSPFRSSRTSPRRNDFLTYNETTPDADSIQKNSIKKITERLLDAAHVGDDLFGHARKRYSSLKQKVEQKEKIHQHQLELSMTPEKKEDPTLFSQIYNRSVFRSRRTTPGTTPVLSPNNVMSSSYNRTIDGKQKPQNKKLDNDTDLGSPYMKIALKRMINKSYEVGRLVVCLLLFTFYKLICAIVTLLRIKVELKGSSVRNKDTTLFTIMSYVNYAIYVGLLLNILIAVVRLLKPQDKCLDLPLTDSQRKILGLPQIHSTDDIDEPNIIGKAEVKEEPPILKYSGSPNRSGIENDISRSFASMNISRLNGLTQNSGVRPLINLNTPSKDKGPSSPEKIKERLLSAHRQNGTHRSSFLDRTLNSPLDKTSSFDRTHY